MLTESMSPAEPPSRRAERVRRAIPPILVLAAAVGYLGADLWLDELPATVPGDVSPICLLYTSPSPRDRQKSRMPSSA